MAQESAAAALRAQLRDALASAAESEVTAAAEASEARAKWASEAAQLAADHDALRTEFEQAVAQHERDIRVCACCPVCCACPLL